MRKACFRTEPCGLLNFLGLPGWVYGHPTKVAQGMAPEPSGACKESGTQRVPGREAWGDGEACWVAVGAAWRPAEPQPPPHLTRAVGAKGGHAGVTSS